LESVPKYCSLIYYHRYYSAHINTEHATVTSITPVYIIHATLRKVINIIQLPQHKHLLFSRLY
jgi:hypothetical protein